MAGISELRGVEKPVTEWLSKMGWTYRSHADLKEYDRPLSNPIITQVLTQKMMAFNQASESDARRAVDQLLHLLNNPSPILGNENFLDKLVKGVTLIVDGAGRGCLRLVYWPDCR